MLSAEARVPQRVELAGVSVDALDFDAVVDAIVARAQDGAAPAYVVTPNAHHVTLLQDDPLLREIYGNAFLVVPDGVPLLWAARLLGTPLRGRVNGTDLFERLCARAADHGLSVFLLGGREGAADAAAAKLRARHPALRICGTCCPPLGFETDPAQSARVTAAIETARPHLLFVGLGAPKQEYWMYRNCGQLQVPVSLGIGVSFEFVAGTVPRAPRWMQRTGLEWLHRVVSEPKRLWKRYLAGNARFCYLIARQYAGYAATRGRAARAIERPRGGQAP